MNFEIPLHNFSCCLSYLNWRIHTCVLHTNYEDLYSIDEAYLKYFVFALSECTINNLCLYSWKQSCIIGPSNVQKLNGRHIYFFQKLTISQLKKCAMLKTKNIFFCVGQRYVFLWEDFHFELDLFLETSQIIKLTGW